MLTLFPNPFQTHSTSTPNTFCVLIFFSPTEYDLCCPHTGECLAFPWIIVVLSVATFSNKSQVLFSQQLSVAGSSKSRGMTSCSPPLSILECGLDRIVMLAVIWLWLVCAPVLLCLEGTAFLFSSRASGSQKSFSSPVITSALGDKVQCRCSIRAEHSSLWFSAPWPVLGRCFNRH